MVSFSAEIVSVSK